MKKIEKRIFLTVGLTLLVTNIWILIEYLVEGTITDSLVDNLVLLLLIPVFYFAVLGLERRTGKAVDDTGVKKVFAENNLSPEGERIVYAILLKFGVDSLRNLSRVEFFCHVVENGSDSLSEEKRMERRKLLRVASELCKSCSDDEIFSYFKMRWKKEV